MNIKKESVVSLEFELKDAQGELLDSSSQDGPMVYMHGQGHLPEKLESALDNKAIFDNVEIKLKSEDAYGDYSDDMVQTVKKSDVEGIDDLSPGQQFPAETDNGMMMFTVLDIQDENITLDGNHPLAGKDLHFKVKVIDVRQATKEELAHGHVHGPGGHEH